jgi:uncharacterized membrane protein
MKRDTTLLLAFSTALTLVIAGCSSGGGSSTAGGGGGVLDLESDPTFTTTAALTDAVAGAPFSAAVDLNDGAIVAGTSDNTLGSLRAVVWSVGASGASTPALLPTATDVFSRANGVNNAGVIVGEMGEPAIEAVIWSTSSTAAAALPGTGAGSAAYAVNDAGVIVGEIGNPPVAVAWENAATPPTTLPSTGTSSAAYDINNGVDVTTAVGEMTDGTGTHAVAWRETGGIIEQIVLPGTATLNGTAVALSINDDGNIAGEITHSDGTVHAVRWIKGDGTAYSVEDLGPGSAAGINLAGRAVGTDGQGGTIWRRTAPLTPFPIGTVNPADSLGVAINTAGRAVGVNVGKAFIALP